MWSDNGYNTFNWVNSVYTECLESDKTHIGLNGEYLRKVDKWKDYDRDLHFHDMKPHQKYLVENYYNTDEISNTHKEVFFDIEIEMGESLTEEYIKKSVKKVTSVAYYYKQKDSWVVLILDESNKIKTSNKKDTEILVFKSEEDLLIKFVELFKEIQPDILIGWNSDYFDIPYLYYRIRKVLGEDIANSLSPIGYVEETPWLENQYIDIAGVQSVDFLRIHKKFSMQEEESYKLDRIGKKYVNIGKVEYEGNLDDLYRTDILKFIDYNIVDVKILIELDNHFDYISLVKNLCHKGKVNYSEVYNNTSIHDGAISSYVLSKNLIPPSKSNKMKFNKNYSGGFTFIPFKRVYDNLFDLDLVSLYPSIIMSLNIGKETYVSRLVTGDFDDDRFSLLDLKEMDSNNKITIETNTLERFDTTIKEVIDYIESNNFSITANGCIFDLNTKSVLSSILDKWFNERVEYKNKMKEYDKLGNKELYSKFKLKQYTLKILLNSLYGATSLPSFRYGNIILAQSITATGRRIIQESAYYINQEINKELV